MLKALELNGFKSFADRTRFEFPLGITSIVGPNGSGKSNIVDAIKWVLGSQSAKALRGKEMTDVIFSGTHNRKQTNSAEVTLIFDNTDGILDYDSEEVQITRRVYRSGEGEYLINRQPVRLRDIREVFSGTGVSTGAYSIIEQGKVDALLQSSPKDRRLMFEEAAGVSRFKLKREEAARRLQRVDQNLLRLSDIVEELDSRLRSVRSQAGKARKYKEQSDRLRFLRTQIALADWHELDSKLQNLKAEHAKKNLASETIQKQTQNGEEQLSAVESEVDQQQEQLNQINEQASLIREQIAQGESTRRSQLARCDELELETQRLQRQLLAMTSKAGNVQLLVTETTSELESAEKNYHELQSKASEEQSQFDQVQQAQIERRNSLEQIREQQNSLFREISQLENRIETLEHKQSNANAETESNREKLQQTETTFTELNAQQSKIQEQLQATEKVTADIYGQLTEVETRLSQSRQQFTQSQSELADLRGKLTGAKERAIVLEELERRLDGLSAGTKEVLKKAQEDPNGPFGCVRGIVADLLHVDADTASLVETALGERANQLLIDRTAPEFLKMNQDAWAGRTSFLRLDVPQPASAVDRIDLSSEPGVMGRADEFVETSPDLSNLARRLLGRWWFVDTLQTAMKLATGIGRGLNFVTVVGEVVSAEGTLVVGPRQSTTGLLSRRSELRALVDEIQEIEKLTDQKKRLCKNLESSIQKDEEIQKKTSVEHKQLAEQLSKSQLQYASISERTQQAKHALVTVQSDFEKAIKQIEDAQAELIASKNEHQEKQELQLELEKNQLSLNQQLKQFDEQTISLQKTLTDSKVALARGEQRRDGLRHQMEQLQRDREEHDRALAETKEREKECHQQQLQLKQSILDLGTELAELYRKKEIHAAESQKISQNFANLRKQRVHLLKTVDKLREQLLQSQNQLQQAEFQLQQSQQQRTDLCTRLSEDYDLDLPVLAKTEPMQELGPRVEVDEEISTLRQSLQNIGPVNTDALTELEAVEDRHVTLAKQYEDLQQAKVRLEQLVAKINVESRELFVQALDVIRTHFQELYCNLFGGGEADIIIDDSENEDVLECGIEIIARPPGKQPRSISLLSGGERTMTCVALLLAIFRSRPSPFCVLDEVDAALDEANIARFVEVLKEFMSSTQFLVVTHSKRTMSCADTLYGITMHESGISKRVSVRFEDVSEDGHIRENSDQAKAA